MYFEYFKNFPDNEAYPLSFSSILLNSQILINDLNYFINGTYNKVDLTETETERINYQSYICINNAYKNFLPNNMNKIEELPKILQNYNDNSMKKIKIVIFVYAILIGFMCVLYTILLYVTNNYIRIGFEKISKIKEDKIDETIKKLENFNKELNVYKEKNYSEKLINKDKIEIEDDENETFLLNDKYSNKKINNNNINNNYLENNNNYLYGEDNNNNLLINIGKNKKSKLIIFTWAYLQPIILIIIVCSFLIPVYYLTHNLIVLTNEIIDIQTYLYENVIQSSCNLIYLKYYIRFINEEDNINEITINNNFSLREIITSISKFDKILKLYNTMQTDVCSATFDKKSNSIQYIYCKNDKMITFVNNTNAIFSEINEKVNDLLKLLNTYMNDDDYEPMSFYENDDLVDLEYLYYNYLVFVTDNIEKITLENQQDKLNNKKNITKIFYALVIIETIIFALIIWTVFIKRIIYLLSVARFILKIIPINVIYNTQELQSWIDESF